MKYKFRSTIREKVKLDLLMKVFLGGGVTVFKYRNRDTNSIVMIDFGV